MVFWGLYWGPLILRNYQIYKCKVEKGLSNECGETSEVVAIQTSLLQTETASSQRALNMFSCSEKPQLQGRFAGIVILKYTEYGFGYIIIGSPNKYTPNSIYLRGTICACCY